MIHLSSGDTLVSLTTTQQTVQVKTTIPKLTLVSSGKGGTNGVNGKDAYEVAVDAGFQGTREQWLASLGSGISDKFYSANINGETDLVVAHNLNKYPSITVVNSAYDEVEGSYTYLSNNSVNLHFDATFSGKVYFN